MSEIRKTDIALSIAPSPAAHNCTAAFTLSKDETVEAGVYDAIGRFDMYHPVAGIVKANMKYLLIWEGWSREITL